VTEDERITPLVKDAVNAVLDSNNRAQGDYILIAEISYADDESQFKWRWFWSPKAPAIQEPVT
jgi:hypothetical protein